MKGPPEAHSHDLVSILVLDPKSEPRTSLSRPGSRVLVDQRPLKSPYSLVPSSASFHSPIIHYWDQLVGIWPSFGECTALQVNDLSQHR